MKINSKHRVLSIILSVLMALSLMPATVFAADETGHITVNGNEYGTYDAAVAAAVPENGIITYTVSGKVPVTSTDAWIEVLRAGLENVTAVKFVGGGDGAELSIENPTSVLADQEYDIDVSFEKLTLSHPNGAWVADLGHATNYFACLLRNVGASENTVTYTDCVFSNGACNNFYGKTVFESCSFNNAASGKYNLWNYGGSTDVKNSTFTGTRGIKTYNEGTLEVAPDVTIENTAFTGLTEKPAIVSSKATDVTFNSVTVTDCAKGMLTRDISGNDEVTISANGSNISGTFNITGDAAAANVKDEFNISGGTFTSEVSSDYLADGFEIEESVDPDGNKTYGVAAKDYGYVVDESGNITITSADGLFWFAEQANAGNNFAGKTVKLANDIDLNDKLWTPIGIYNDSKTHFKGTFDGQGHTVSGVNVVESRKNGVGFFGKVYTGTIKNLTVVGNITTDNCNYVGGIVGHGYATVVDCVFRGNVGSANTMQVGGIAGSGGFTVTRCSVYGNVTAECWAGGIVGNCQDGGSYTDCYVEGEINAERTYWGGGAAGITPVPLYPSQVITGCYSNTVVKVAGKEVNCPIIATYNNPLDYNGYTGGLKIYDNSWNKQKNPNDSYPLYAEKNGVGGVLVEGGDVARDNNLVMLDDDLNYVDDLSKVRIMSGSSVTQGQVDALAVAKVGEIAYTSLDSAFEAAKDGDTVTLLADITEDVVINKNITFDLGGKTITNTGAGKATLTVASGATATVKNGSIVGGASYYNIQNNGTATLEGITATAGNTGSSMIDNWGTLTITSGTYTGGLNVVKSEEGSTLVINGGDFTLNYAPSSGYTAVILVYGDTTITSGTFTQTATPKWGSPQVVMTGVVEGYPAITRITGGTFVNKKSGSNIFHGLGKATSDNFEVSGGSFNKSISDGFCADGFIPTQNEDGTYGVKIGTYVAETNGVKYESLEEAINAATRDKTVTMLADTRENVTISKNLILDLNGFTINGGQVKGKATVMIDNARVTIMDSSAGQTGTIMREDTAENSGDSSYYVIDIQGKNGFLKFTGGNVKNDSGIVGVKGASLVRLGDDSVAGAYPTLTIYGGTFTQNNFVAIKVDRGTLHFVGGVITSANSYAVENWNNAYIKGGTVNGTVSSWVYSTGAAFSKLEISGGTVNGNVASVNYDSAADKQARIFVTGGTVTGTLGTYTYTNGLVPTDEAAMATIEVTAGTFEKNPTKYVVEGSAVKTNDDGTFGVEKAYLAKVGDTSYYTMDEAFHAALNSGETLYLLRDYTTGTEQNSGSKNLTIDLGGHTWTYTGKDTNCAAFEINYSDVTLTVKNGTVISNTMVGLIPTAMSGSITYNNSALVFENVTMTANGRSGIETNGGNTNDNVTLINSTLNVPNGYGIYFPSSGTLTINNSVINAKTMGVQICAGSLNIVGDGTKITVTGDGIEKTENDGAIEDGAAISIVDRTGYKGLESIKIEAGTFVAKDGNDALKAYKWENKTESAFDNANNTVAVSGGTFSSAVKKEYCADGYKSVTDSNGNYTVKEANITVKVSSNISAAGTLTGGDMYAKGETVTVTATVNPGYVFLGWYDASGKLVNANTSYTFEAAESVDLIATFKGNKNVKLSVGLSGGIVTVSGDVTAKWRNDVKDNEFLLGTSFVLTAAPRAGYTFLYWINSEGRILSDEPEYKFTLGMDTSIKACFMETEQWEDSSYVIFRDNITKKIIWSGDVEMTAHSDGIYGTVAAPALLNYSGVTFKDWRDADGNVVTPDENGNIRITSNITIYAIYQATSDTFDVTVDGETVGSYGFRTSVSVTAPETKDGKYFAGWYRDGVLVSTNASYSFIIRSATALTTEYTDTKQEPASVAILTVGDREQKADGDVVAPFSLDWSLAEGCELVKVGIIRTYDASLKDKLTLENVNGSTIKTKESVLTTSDGNYLYNLTMLPETAVNDVYMTGYVMYRAANGNIITLYTDVVTSPAGN